jgi:hypothetical protein
LLKNEETRMTGGASDFHIFPFLMSGMALGLPVVVAEASCANSPTGLVMISNDKAAHALALG